MLINIYLFKLFFVNKFLCVSPFIKKFIQITMMTKNYKSINFLLLIIIVEVEKLGESLML